MRTLLLPIVFCALAAPAGAQSLQVIGYSGYLGEWELTATVTEIATGDIKQYFGPLTMKHVGLCTQDGPEQKTGEMRLQIAAASSQLNATLSVGGIQCTYSARKSDFYNGTMNCPDQELVPLKLWLR